MEFLHESLAGLGNFLLYFSVCLVSLLIFKVVYTFLTPHDEWQLVKTNNVSAAYALVGAIIGFSVAIAGAVANSVSMLDFGIWAIISMVAQLIAFVIVRLFMPRICDRITDGEPAAGIMLGGVSVAIGVLNAACMTY